MTGSIDARLAQLGLTLPTPTAPIANYLPFVVAAGLIFVSGQISMGPGGLITGKLGRDLDLAAGQAAALACGLGLLAQAKAAAGGDLDRIAQVVRLGAFVHCTDDFVDQPQVVNGCSDLMVAVFGDAGRHARSAVGVNSLPRGVAVEIDGVFALHP